VIYRCEGNLRSNLLVEILEHWTVKIFGIVNCDVSRDAIARDDILPKEVFDGCRAYVCNRFPFNPLCEIFDGHHREGVVALC
jgi:hypothetical protein